MLNPAVRAVNACVDESGCDWEKVTLCSFAQTTKQKAQVDFLVCMDESESRSATDAAKACASEGGLDYDAISTCFGGSQGASLLAKASKVFNDKFPQRSTIPHIFVNDVDTQPKYSALSSALCNDGSAAKVCKSGVAVEPSTCSI